jgi:hypothetical protein
LFNAKQLWSLHFILFLAVLALTSCGGSSSSNGGGGGGQQVSVTISNSPPATIGAGANWTYTATVSGSTNQTVSWGISPASAGSIDTKTGFYVAPNAVPSSPQVTITATALADSSATASATVTVQATDPLGTVASYTVYPQPNSCPTGGAGSVSGGTCIQLALACPGVANFSAYLKVNNPGISPVGTVLFGTGTGGSGLYDDPTAGGYTYGGQVVQNILSAGYNTVQVSFGAPFDSGSTPNGWLTGPGGVRRLACRYATVADWVYKNPAIVNATSVATNSHPMCATGNSGGSAAIAYAVYEYGLGTEFSMVEPTSGPVMSRIDQGCAPCSSDKTGFICGNASNPHPQLCYETADAAIIDEAYQSAGSSSPTPCSDALNGNPGSDAPAQFLSDSILYQGQTSVPLPATLSVKQLFGDDDSSNAVPEGMAWNHIVTPNPPVQCLSGVAHDLPSYSSGATQVASDITTYCK